MKHEQVLKQFVWKYLTGLMSGTVLLSVRKQDLDNTFQIFIYSDKNAGSMKDIAIFLLN